MTRIPVRQTLWIAALALMAGCGAISKASAPLDAYTLSPLPVSTPARATSRHLVVELPTSSGALATDRILIKPNPLQAQYLPKGQWVEPAPMLLQNLLVASLQNSGAFRLVGRDGAGLTPDYVLLVEVNDFQAEAAASGATETPVHVGLTITLVREQDRNLIASRRFDQTVVAASSDTMALVTAFDTATRQMLTEAVLWTQQKAN